jgi:arylsulfatase A-like enzyme
LTRIKERTVAMPGKRKPRLHRLLHAAKLHGCATGQFGKNHLGDKDKFLPTKHGFDEYFGNLDHRNAEEEGDRAARRLASGRSRLDAGRVRADGIETCLSCVMIALQQSF